VFETVPAEPTTIEFPWPAKPLVFPAETSNPAGGATVMPVAKFEPDKVKLVGEADGVPKVVLTEDRVPLAETVGANNVTPVNFTSSTRMALVPVLTKRSLRPLICAPTGKDKGFAAYQAIAAVALSLKRSVAVFATVTQAEPFQ